LTLAHIGKFPIGVAEARDLSPAAPNGKHLQSMSSRAKPGLILNASSG